MTPGETAAADQALKAADRDLDRMTVKFREQAAEHGDMQALANMALALTWMPRAAVSDIALAALRRLARDDPEAGG